MKNLNLGKASFEYLIKESYLYVDKTEYIYKMVRKGTGSDFYFVSRPRRFGKSLMCSTLHELFKGRKELFKDLYIAGTEYDFKEYPVLHFDFSMLSTVSYKAFLSDFRNEIQDYADQNGINIETGQPSSMLGRLLKVLDNPVIIIDEFDSPIIDAVSKGKKELAESMRDEFNAFYKVLKGYNGKIRFFFMTGCTKLSGLNLFSSMNNLSDITRDPDYAGMFGYTDEELESCFGEYIDDYLAREEMPYKTRPEMLSAIADYYDGYRFSQESELKVYNPVSLGKLFLSKNYSFDTYWEDTGISTLAVQVARKADLIAIMNGEISLTTGSIKNFDMSELLAQRISQNTAVCLLYYAGYLTIKEGSFKKISFTFPNTEVRETFGSSLLGMYAKNSEELASAAIEFATAAVDGNVERMVKEIGIGLDQTAYQLFKKPKTENPYHIFTSAFITASGFLQSVEDNGPQGRADIVFKAGRYIYIFELKTDKSYDIALDQISDKGYFRKYREKALSEHLTIIGVGISFDSEKRSVGSSSSMVLVQK